MNDDRFKFRSMISILKNYAATQIASKTLTGKLMSRRFGLLQTLLLHVCSPCRVSMTRSDTGEQKRHRPHCTNTARLTECNLYENFLTRFFAII